MTYPLRTVVDVNARAGHRRVSFIVNGIRVRRGVARGDRCGVDTTEIAFAPRVRLIIERGIDVECHTRPMCAHAFLHRVRVP